MSEILAQPSKFHSEVSSLGCRGCHPTAGKGGKLSGISSHRGLRDLTSPQSPPRGPTSKPRLTGSWATTSEVWGDMNTLTHTCTEKSEMNVQHFSSFPKNAILVVGKGVGPGVRLLESFWCPVMNSKP